MGGKVLPLEIPKVDVNVLITWIPKMGGFIPPLEKLDVGIWAPPTPEVPPMIFIMDH